MILFATVKFHISYEKRLKLGEQRKIPGVNTGCVRKKLYNFQSLIAKKVNKARQQHSNGQKHNLFCVRFFKWYHSMVRCKSYGPLSDEW